MGLHVPDAPRRRRIAHLISPKNGKDLKVLHLAPMPNVSNHVSWRPLPSLPPCGKLVFWLASAFVTQGPIEHRNLKHGMSQSFSYWHVMVSRPVSCRFGQCERPLPSQPGPVSRPGGLLWVVTSRMHWVWGYSARYSYVKMQLVSSAHVVNYTRSRV
eukprot:COSAG06_NODE_6423_length_2939_cov_1.753521_5_plen_157_part_00